MFLIRRPSPREIDEFLDRSAQLPLSYEPVGIASESPKGFSVDEASGLLGQGFDTFTRAKLLLTEWKHFDLGWVELLPRGVLIEPGNVVAVLVHHLGLWSLNGCRILYRIDYPQPDMNFGFAYGTLTNHTELGEESFEVVVEPESERVIYRIRAVSKPRAALARIGYPITRFYQERFRRDSVRAMQSGSRPGETRS